jgi:ankyrin repeat protein
MGAALAAGNIRNALLIYDECPAEPGYFVCSPQPLALAAKMGSIDLYNKLLAKGVTYDETISAGLTPLHYLSHRVQLDFVQYLKQDYSVDTLSGAGLSPLQSLVLGLRTMPEAPVRGPPDWADVLSDGLIEELLSGSKDPEALLSNAWDTFCTRVVAGWKWHDLAKCHTPLVVTMTRFRGADIATRYHAAKKEPATTVLFKALKELNDQVFSLDFVSFMVESFLEVGEKPDLAVAHDHSLRRMLTRSLSLPLPRKLRETLLKLGVCPWCMPSGLKPTGPPAIAASIKRPVEEFMHIVQSSRVRPACEECVANIEPALEILAFELIRSKGCNEFRKFIYLLQSAGVSANARCSPGVPLLAAACDYKRTDILNLLLQNGADIHQGGVEIRWSLAAAASRTGEMTILRLLASEGFNWSSQFDLRITEQSAFGRRMFFKDVDVVHIASLYGQLGALQFFLDESIVTDWETRSVDKLTPLHFAVIGRAPQIITFLAQRGIDMNPQDFRGAFPVDLALDYAKPRGNVEIARRLMFHGSRNTSKPGFELSGLVYVPKKEFDEAELLDQSRRSRLKALKDGLKLAIQYGDPASCNAIIANPLGHVDMNLGVDCEIRPIFHACGLGIPETVEWFLKQGASLEPMASETVHPALRSVMSRIAADRKVSRRCLRLALYTALSNRISWIEDEINAIHAAILAGNNDALGIIVVHLKKHSTEIW